MPGKANEEVILMNKHKLPLLPSPEKLHASLAIMQALAHPLRLSMLHLIDNNLELKVGDIYKILKIEQALASQHLRILRQADLVLTRRDQKFIYYRINYVKMLASSSNAPKLSVMVE